MLREHGPRLLAAAETFEEALVDLFEELDSAGLSPVEGVQMVAVMTHQMASNLERE